MAILQGCVRILIIVCLSCVAFDVLAQDFVRVRLKRNISQVEIGGMGIRIESPSVAINLNEALTLGKWKIKKLSGTEWRVQNTLHESHEILGEQLVLKGQLLRLGIEPVPYELDLISVANNKFDVIAKMDLDSYLSGVLPSEMPLAWPLEALKAQTIAARSYVLRTAIERKEFHYDVDSTIQDQVYKFMSADSLSSEHRFKLAAAISQTRGQVLQAPGGGVLKAYYHADCGCQTEDPKYVWGAAKGFASVKDPTCARRKTYRWKLTLQQSELNERLLQYFQLPQEASLKNLKVISHTPSGRVALIEGQFSLSTGEKFVGTLNSQNFRKLFGFEKIKSSQFQMILGRVSVYLEGQGLGHGVGLCQWGTRAMAAEGSSYLDILKNFYPQAKINQPKVI